eukprot:gene3461-3732_t
MPAQAGRASCLALGSLEQQLLKFHLPDATVTAILAAAPGWPSLSKLLTRPAGALKQQLHNLASWLRLPLGARDRRLGGLAAEQLMALVTARPAVLSLSKAQLQHIVRDKPTWSEELQSLQGQQLLQWLPKAAAAFDRISFLAAGGSSTGQLWQTVGLADAVALSDESFVEMFPEAQYESWKDYAARLPAWEQEICSWDEVRWTRAVAAFAPSKIPVLDFLLQSQVGSSGTQSLCHSHPELQRGQRGRPRSSISTLTLLTAVAGTTVEFTKKFPLYETWRIINDAVAPVPSWSAQWKALTGPQLWSVLEEVDSMQPASEEAVRQEQYHLHLQQLFGHRKTSSSTAAVPEAADTAAGLEDLLFKIRVEHRLERLQLMVRCEFQQNDILRNVLLMPESIWHARYPIAQQLAELQAAAAGVPAWESTLAVKPAGSALVSGIDTMHARRSRLVWLKQQHAAAVRHLPDGEDGIGLDVPGLHRVRGSAPVLTVLNLSEQNFKELYPAYPGDGVKARENSTADPALVAQLYDEYVKLKTQSDALRTSRNENSAAMKGKLEPEQRQALIAKGQLLKQQLEDLEAQLLQIEGQRIPNLTHPDVPESNDEDAATVLHLLALVNWAMGRVAAQGFQVLSTPDLVRVDVLEKCGFQPRMENTQVLLEKELPIKMVAFGRCFRTEAGAAGSAGKGLYRVHQFTKVEMFVLSTPEQSDALHQELIQIEQNLFAELGLHFKRYGEISSASNCTDYQSRRLNISVRVAIWALVLRLVAMLFVETAGMRYRPAPKGQSAAGAAAIGPDAADGGSAAKKGGGKGGGKKGAGGGGGGSGATAFVHTLNATACAVPRMIVAILENFQQADGSVVVPEVLRPYLGGLEVIRPPTPQ